MSSKLEIKKTCAHCTKIFIAKQVRTMYCSHKCSQGAYKHRKQTENKNSKKSDFYKPNSHQLPIIYYKDYLNVEQTAVLLGISRSTVYRYLNANVLKFTRIRAKTFIRRLDIDSLLDPDVSESNKATKLISDYYQLEDIIKKYRLAKSTIYSHIRQNNIDWMLQKGQRVYDKEQIDLIFSNITPDNRNIGWYSVNSIIEIYGMTREAIYTFVNEHGILKKREGIHAFYSKDEFDKAKKRSQYYSTEEVEAKFGINRDALYGLIKRHNIAHIKSGRYIQISKHQLDSILLNQ